MYSIENFYFILHQHLLKPLNIRDALYYKFGSVDSTSLILGQYLRTNHLYGIPQLRGPWCYFFDQEPLNYKDYSECIISNSDKRFKTLANSEHSSLKQKLLKNDCYQDWYYFFHGFAALDWFRDGQYFDQQIEWTRPYITLNRLHVNDRSYRLNLVARLAEQNLVNLGHVSLHLGHTEYGTWRQELESPNTRLSSEACALIDKHLAQPLILDQDNTTGSLSANFGCQEFELWKSGLWHIVTETVFYHDKLHLTEKIFKPIVAQRPFMLAAAPGNLAYLKSYGFRTFDQWIDESYDNIQDPDLRLQAIVDQTSRLCAMSDSELREMHKEMQPILEHNFDHLWTTFKHQIVDELVNNFERSIRLWNNGRIDGKELPLQNIDLARVKQILLR
jgi:hypothetical protein